MGKKHKKHKSEKHAYDEYTERPLKLVLKVAGTEVTTGSTSLDDLYDEQSDYDKHKDKKKKKKKKEDKDRSSPASPVDEKKRKKVTKKRKGQDSVDTDWEDREQSRTPVRSDVSQDRALSSSVASMDEKEQTPLQEALNQLIRQLQRKDPNGFFSFPVTDLIAPGYSMIIKRPMDFSTMKDKVKKECYQSLEELKMDFKLMCENAMIYNKPETIYYKAAKKLLHSGMKILSLERLESLKQSIKFMADLENSSSRPGDGGEEEGASSLDQSRDGSSPMDTSETTQSPNRLNKDTPRQDRDSKDEVLKSVTQAEKDLEEIQKIIEESGGKLSTRELQSELLFERRKSDGTTSLTILNSADLSAGDPGYCPVKLGMMSGRLQTGINILQGFKEDKRNRALPVTYLNYGPFSSYAPTYDSSFANISKEDSDLIYSFYGEESSLQGSDSVADFLSKSEENMTRLADRFLDTLTNGEHSKQLKDTEANNTDERDPAEGSGAADEVEVVESEPHMTDNVASPSSVVGIDFDFFMTPLDSKEAQQFQEKLDETTHLLHELQDAQRERLSTPQPANIICLLAPTTKELQLAEKVTGNLAHLTSQVTPADVSNVYGIRRAMGINISSEPEELQVDTEEMQEPRECVPPSQEDVSAIAV
ncbi:bromodomain-containing protein 7 isoform X2 [Denticeps clupeoides]|uniref:bromodomain-containing protein 7 isoform X2 n=1 Tax=Denticeps clupeoides TaxID=299321 RepID=UPI0010A414EB|nr:bromodomain-containing protein 7 isoform X2 [Denticeps clupeoides]